MNELNAYRKLVAFCVTRSWSRTWTWTWNRTRTYTVIIRLRGEKGLDWGEREKGCFDLLPLWLPSVFRVLNSALPIIDKPVPKQQQQQ